MLVKKKKQEWRSCHRNKNVQKLGDEGRKALKRRNPDFQGVEINAAKQRKYGANTDNCIKCFKADIANSPIFICSCCHQTWFKQSVSEIKSDSWNLPAKYLTLSQNKPWFLRVYCTSLLKTLWKRENLLVTSIFSIFHSVSYPFG